MPWFASAYAMGLVTTMLVWATFALSLQLLVGGAGMVSLGHAAFFGIGAYTVQWLGSGLGAAPSLLLSLPAAALAGGVAAAAVGVFALRTRGFFFLMTTLAFGQMLFFLFHDSALGGGTDGVFVIRPAFSAFGWAWAPQPVPAPGSTAADQPGGAGSLLRPARLADAHAVRPRPAGASAPTSTGWVRWVFPPAATSWPLSCWPAR